MTPWCASKFGMSFSYSPVWGGGKESEARGDSSFIVIKEEGGERGCECVRGGRRAICVKYVQ